MNNLQILKQLEKQLNIKFEKIDINKTDYGYSPGTTTNYSTDFNNNIIAIQIENIIIEDISLIGELYKLKELCLTGNEITDISTLENLKELKELYLHHNQIKNISALKNLNKLEIIILTDNQLKDISVLTDLTQIKVLYLDFNQIEDISALENLILINNLNLSFNKIKDIRPLQDLKEIEYIELIENQIEDISAIKTLFLNGKFSYDIDDNPLKYPPKEIIKLGKEAINEYFEHTKKGTTILQEAKLIIIGEAGAGKTTFAKKILNPNAKMPKPEDTTRGINVHNWSYEELKTKTFNAKLWDFGGQDIYHGTHQFFFSDKSLYVLLADTREQKTDFNYWLNTVEQLTGENSPLIILLNKKQNHRWKINKIGLKKRFGNIIRKIITIDLSNSSEIPELQNTIKNQISNLPQIGYFLPATWVEVRQKLTKIDKKFISYEQFRNLCKETGIINKQVIENMSKLFSNIGIFTHFTDDFSSLQDIIFLDSNWLTETVYLLLNNEKVEKKYGRITTQDIKEIWQDEVYFEINKFIELLKKFSLIYKINGSNNYIVPEHLSEEQPYEEWQFSEQNSIYQFRYLFDNYMPKGIMAKLIVALHQYIYDDKLVWTRGINIANSIKNPDTFAEIIETYGREYRFDIKIHGKKTADLLQTIIYHFDRILKPFKKLTHEKLVPCNCDSCKTNKNPYFHEYSDLLERKKNKKQTIECRKKPYIDVDINELLFGINFTSIKSLLINMKFNEFEEVISQKFSDISYQIHKEKVTESYFHSVLHTILSENGLKPVSEESTNDGRVDLHFTIGYTKYLFELKKDTTADDALNQIFEKRYYKKFQRNFEKIILVGINFSSQKRNIDGIKFILDKKE